MADLVWSDPEPEKEDFAVSPRKVGSMRFAYHQGRWLYLRGFYSAQISRTERHEPCLAGAPIMYGGVLGVV